MTTKIQTPEFGSRLDEARYRREEIRKRLKGLRADGGRITRAEGALLTSRGDWEILAAKLIQQAGSASHEMLFAGILTQGNEEEAVRMTAGLHPRLGNLTTILNPVPVFFTFEERDLLLGLFELVLWNPAGPTMHLYREEDFEKLTGQVDLIGATKAFGTQGDSRGLAAFEKIKSIGSRSADKRILYHYISGYTGAVALLKKHRFPWQEELGRAGVHLGVVGDDWDDAVSIGRLLTNQEESQRIDLDSGHHLLRFKNQALEIPLIVDVCGDQVLRDVQATASIWKNVGSICLGLQLFEKIFAALKADAGLEDAHIAARMSLGYSKDIQDMISAIREILIRVEGFPPQDVLLLPATLKDFEASWHVEEMSSLVSAVRNIFYSGKKLSQSELESLADQIAHSFSTRNPAGGFMGKIPSLQKVHSKKTYEGWNTLKHIHERFSLLSKRQGKTKKEIEACLSETIVKLIRELQI